jgi:hypothetical protein
MGRIETDDAAMMASHSYIPTSHHQQHQHAIFFLPNTHNLPLDQWLPSGMGIIFDSSIREGEMSQRVSTIMLDVFTKIVKISDIMSEISYGPILG